MEESFINSVIAGVLNPEPIYEGMVYISSIAAFIPWLFVVVIAIRLYRESLKNLSFKASLSEAIGDTSKTFLVFLAYTLGGMLTFTLMFAFAQIFSEFGSTELIHQDMLDLRNTLMVSPEETKAWYESVAGYVADIGAAPISILIYLLFQSLSVVYVIMTQLIEVLFALAVIALYAWGFLVIPTMTLGNDFDLTKGWIRSALTLFIWIILEPILLGSIFLMGSAGSAYISSTYAGMGMGVNSMIIWYLYSIITMFMVVLTRIIAPFIAVYLSKNESFVSAIAGAAAGTAAILLHQSIANAQDKDSHVRNQLREFLGGVAPDGEGLRNRDSLARHARHISDFMNTPVGDAARRVSSGLGGLASRFSGGGAGDEAGEGGGGGGGAASGGEASTDSQGARPDAPGQENGSSGDQPQAANDLNSADHGGAQTSPRQGPEGEGSKETPAWETMGGGQGGQNDLSASYEAYVKMQETAAQPADEPDVDVRERNDLGQKDRRE